MGINKVEAYYPINYNLCTIDKVIYKLSRWFFYCNCCGNYSYLTINKNIVKNPTIELREHVFCKKCESSNRNRQIAKIICCSKNISNQYKSLKDFVRNEKIVIYNTENSIAIHETIMKYKNKEIEYVSSEYLGQNFKSGEIINGVMHQDIMATSFDNDYFDLVISSDVLEHVPDPWKAFKEIHRILKPGGRHVFTVPFYQDRSMGENRAYINEKGELVNVKEPWFHIDPLRPEGTLVYNIFSIDLLQKLDAIFSKNFMYVLHSVYNGILASNAIVFESIK